MLYSTTKNIEQPYELTSGFELLPTICEISKQMQLCPVLVISAAEGSSEEDLKAEWIYKQVFC
ncbi:transcription elongation factor SPT6-like isoform X1 [Vespula squamosa]|uniref:Transcription elongation factor SPT6-like isoform X1 n=1 Tax=Vespula squamosa TaxID=30214 RepID=A0ABD2A710_VESSQ